MYLLLNVSYIQGESGGTAETPLVYVHVKIMFKKLIMFLSDFHLISSDTVITNK
jgi:hypothetical protein